LALIPATGRGGKWRRKGSGEEMRSEGRGGARTEGKKKEGKRIRSGKKKEIWYNGGDEE
jgi:hypothetical protein